MEFRVRVALVAILLMATSLRVYHLNYQPLWFDEEDVLTFASETVTNLLTNLIRPGWNGPLYHLLLHYWLKFTGVSSFALRYFSVLTSVMAVGVAWPLGRQWLKHSDRLWLCLLLATSPYLVWYAQDGKMYSLLLLVSLAALFTFYQACVHGNWRYWLAFSILTWVSWFVHLLSVLLLPAYFVIWLTLVRKKHNLHFIIWPLLLVLLYIPFLSWQLPTWLSDFATGHPYVGLSQIIRTQLFVFSVGFPSGLSLIASSLFLFLFIYGLVELRHAPASILVLFWHFVIPILGIFIITQGMPVYADRYLIPIVFSFYGICAFGLARLRQSYLYLTLILMPLVLLLNLTTIYLQANTAIK